ncbi:PAAR-like protein [Chryseobacterium indoltheticum]|uniref:PAAR-like protein n=1 Tax=Chryseobacterium indoltheticum TaxID=254 RepID=UPI0019132759|nr:PAAR-like protein [Chryseobacterium indoltheticum]QQQ27985.1 DUF4280 domain-containing protein [Chryseobacterium indoltheticum]
MADSYIIQGTNVICSNMQIAGPNKIGYSRSKPSIIHKGKNEYYLTIVDKSLEKSFKCKMAAKKWGGLAMLCAGIAIVGIVALCVVTGGAAAPLLLAAAAASQVAIGIAIGAAIVSVGVGLYKEHTDCKALLESPDWQNGHKAVNFQGKRALLNSSFMICQQGGKVQLIVSDVIALEAGKLISSNNSKEVLIQFGSQFLNGVVGGLTGGGSVPGVIMSIGFYLKFESAESNQAPNIADDTKNGGIQYGGGIAEGATKGAYQHGMSKLEAWVWKNVMFSRILNGASQESIDSAANMWGAALAAPGAIWKDFAKSAGVGLGGAVIGFAIDQGANAWERSYERDSMKQIDTFDKNDSKNTIGVFAKEN